MGVHSTYTAALGAEICVRLADGESLSAICRDKHMPDHHTVYDWRRAQPKFDADYLRARDDQADTHVDQITDIADTSPEYFKDEGGKYRVDPAWVAWQKGRVDARKWSAGKMKPQKYGDKLDVSVTTNVADGLERMRARRGGVVAHEPEPD